MNKKRVRIISLIFVICAIIYTILVKKIDVDKIGPLNSEVGFSHFNNAVHQLIGVNMEWYEITKYLGVIPFLFVAFFGLIGLKQLLSTKSISGVDNRIIKLGIFYILFCMVYVFFEKNIINYRPTLIDNELEASYPSSHTLLAICLCGSAMMMLKYYINNPKLLKCLNIIAFVLMVAIVIGRVLSGVHWASDILGGMIISIAMLSLLKCGIIDTEDTKRK